MDAYSAATGDAFGYLFELLAVAAEMQGRAIHGFRELAGSIGNQIGKAIIAFDCAVDFERDQKKGDFNPLENPEQVQSSLQYSSACLQHAHDPVSYTHLTLPTKA